MIFKFCLNDIVLLFSLLSQIYSNKNLQQLLPVYQFKLFVNLSLQSFEQVLDEGAPG